MPAIALVGAQWGDEGKGKIVHFLAERADCIVRYQGGPNAGHTLILDGKPFVLHTIPSGIVHRGKICVIANGVVFDPEILYGEVALLASKNISVKNRLFVSESAHVILPYHKYLDELREKGKIRIGTTRRGIGPAYADKVVRIGIRVCDFLVPEIFYDLLERNLREKKVYRMKKRILKSYPKWRRFLVPMTVNTAVLLNGKISKNENILFESAQGTLLDLDFGTYPYVTSSNPISGGVCTGAGVPPTKIDYVIGIMKAYTTRVGEGPFPTEIAGPVGERLRETGIEYGATTGRPRRCGWFDAVAVKHSIMINGFDSMALTKLDCMRGIDPIKVCIAYRYKGKKITAFPASRNIISKCEPVYVDFQGFGEPVNSKPGFEGLSANAKKYVKSLEKILGIKISLLSLGRSSDETAILDKRVLKFKK